MWVRAFSFNHLSIDAWYHTWVGERSSCFTIITRDCTLQTSIISSMHIWPIKVLKYMRYSKLAPRLYYATYSERPSRTSAAHPPCLRMFSLIGSALYEHITRCRLSSCDYICGDNKKDGVEKQERRTICLTLGKMLWYYTLLYISSLFILIDTPLYSITSSKLYSPTPPFPSLLIFSPKSKGTQIWRHNPQQCRASSDFLYYRKPAPHRLVHVE